jgi:hypothetical protein
MKNWKEEELQRSYAALNEAEKVRAPYEAMTHAATKLLFPSKQFIKSSFESKRHLLRESSHTIAVANAEDGEVLRDLAIAWAEVNLHADTSDDDWFEASVDYVFQLGKYSQSCSGLDAFPWHRELGVHLCIWSHGMLDRLYGGEGEEVERLLRQRIDHDSHPTLGVLLHIPNILHGLGGLVQLKKERNHWIASGSGFFGRLLFTHALCTGIGRLEDSGTLWPRLSVVNGAIASWPYPLVKDRDFTFAFIEKMGAPHYFPEVEPGYFESEAWYMRLLTSARAYLESFRRLFCEGDAQEPSKAGAWKGMGSSLQVFSEIVLVYDIDHYRKP